jgi:hypothetical protein
MRFFWFSGKTNMIREGLRKAVGNEIFLDGKEGEDWSFRDGEFSEDEKRMLKKIEPWLYKDVCLKLSIKQKFHTPKSSEPICVKSKKDLPGILREIGKEKSPDFCIGETVSVKLGSNVIGVVATYAGEKSERHILSPLIDPGFTGPIRTETLYGLDHIDLFLYKTCKPIVNC